VKEGTIKAPMHAAQFERQAHGDDAEPLADQPRISALEIERRRDAEGR